MKFSNLRHLLTGHVGGRQTSLWPAIVAALLAVAWLQPHHYFPWPAFHGNAFVAVWMAGAVVAALLIGVRPREWTLAPCILFGLAGIVWLQWAFGLMLHTGDAIQSSAQFMACAVIWVATLAIYQRHGVERLGDVLFFGFIIAGIGTIGGAMVQGLSLNNVGDFLGIDIWVMTIPDGARAAGNVAQPNEMATLMVWALIGGLWAVHRKLIGIWVFGLLAAYLAIGLGISHSRIGIVEAVAVFLLVFIYRRHLGGWPIVGACFAAILIHMIVFFGLHEFTELMLLDYRGREIDHLANNTARLHIYELVIDAIGKSPWVGYGATTLAMAQWVTSVDGAALHAYYFQSHNIVLDILAWFGIPLGAAIIVGAVVWLVKLARIEKQPEHLIFMFALIVFLLHANVELLHWSPAFLFPAVVFAAVLDGAIKSRVVWRSSITSFILYVVLLISILAATIYDYYRLERGYIHLRAEELGLRTVTEVPEPLVLFHLADYLRMSRMIASPSAPPETMGWMRRTVEGIPNYRTHLTYAITLALNGKREEAAVWLQRLDSVAPASYAESHRPIWSRYQRKYPELIGDMAWPELPTK